MTLRLTARKALVLALALLGAAAAVLLGAHGQAASAASAVKTVRITADPHGALKFTKVRLAVKHGKVKLVMKNPASSGLSHGIGIEGKHIHKNGRVVAAGKTSAITVTLKKGTYEFFCPVPAHKAAGMKGKLIVG